MMRKLGFDRPHTADPAPAPALQASRAVDRQATSDDIVGDADAPGLLDKFDLARSVPDMVQPMEPTALEVAALAGARRRSRIAEFDQRRNQDGARTRDA
jgi:hypothetical protein